MLAFIKCQDARTSFIKCRRENSKTRMNFYLALPRWPSGKGSRSTCQCRRRWIQSLGREDPLEEEMTIRSSILGWEILWTEEPGGWQAMGPQKIRHDWATHTVSLHCYVSFCCSAKCIIYVIHISPPFFGFLSHLGRHRALSRGSCAVQWVLISCLFYTQCH